MAETPPHPDDARLGPHLHRAVFGALPASVARALDEPEVAAVVRRLLAQRWRPAQLATRVGAAPAADDPVGPVLGLLTALLERESPEQAWDRERAQRARERAEHGDPGHAVASPEARERWVAEARRSLGLSPRVRVVPPARPQPRCSSCAGPGELFVTREVRLCGRCVAALATGSASVVGRAPQPAVRAG